MHARIARVKVAPGSAELVAEGWRQLMGDYQATGVFHGLICLHSEDEELAVTVTFWESASAADAVVQDLRSKAQTIFADILQEAPQVSGYEVLLRA